MKRRADWIVLGIYLALAIALTMPLALHFDAHIPGDGGDGSALVWNLWWMKYALFNLETSPLSTDYIFYPLGINLVAFTSTFLNGVLTLPIQFAFGVIVANNGVILFALVVGGYGAFLLAREILSRARIRADGVAALAGMLYAFGAWHISYVAQGDPNLLSNEWLPFYALFLMRAQAARKNGILAGLFVALTAWTELTFVPLIAVFTGLYLLYLFLADRAALDKKFLLNFLLLGAVALLGVSPLIASLLNDFARYGYYLAPGMGRVAIFSAEPLSFFIPPAQHPILGQAARQITDVNTRYAFIGYGALILAALGAIFHRANRDARFWIFAALSFALILLGPTLIVGGNATAIPMPFALLRAIPLVNAERHPVRYNAMLMLSLVPLVALGASYFLRRVRWRGAAFGALSALFIFEQLFLPIPLSDLRAPEIFQTISREPGDFAILDLPLGWRNSVTFQGKLDYKAQFLQTIHAKRMISGQTSRNPAFKFQYFLELPVINSLVALENGGAVDDTRRALDARAAPELTRFFDIRYVVAQRALTDPRVLEYARAIFSLNEIYRDETYLIYRVAATPPPTTIQVGDETARIYFDDGWGRAQYFPDGSGYRWATRGDSALWLPLTRTDTALTFRLRGARDGQKIVARVNEVNVDEIIATTEWNTYTIRVPGAVTREGLNEFVFVTETTLLGAARRDDYVIGDTGIVAPVDIAATGAGFDAGKFGEIFVAGKNVIENKRGYHLVAIHPQTGAVERVGWFDTFALPEESARLAQFIAELSRGEIVAGVAIDEVSRNLQPSAVDALRAIGVESDLRFQFRVGHAFIGVKGAQPGQAIESVNGRFPANVAVGKNVTSDRVAFALVEIIIDR